MKKINYSTTYLTCLGLIYNIAFLSYYVQYPALSSRSGIEPVDRIFDRAFPWLHRLVNLGYFDVDSLVEIINVLGVVISALIAGGIAQHGVLFIAASLVYHFLVVLGGSFYTFQWDILLVETGCLTAMCFAPWQSLKLKSSDADQNAFQVGSWPVRFLLFKLMFMSGVVKIQAECPTWQNLTALEYHFATQCLPGPLAWHAHQLHPLLLRLGVAATFVIEIPATFLLLFPSARVRMIGAWMQILLQVLIISTGNYNFFNLLTMTLCLPCMIGTGGSAKTSMRKIWERLQVISCVIVLAYSSYAMFHVAYVQDAADNKRQMIGITLAMTKHDCNRLSEVAVPVAMIVTIISTLITGVQCIINEKSACGRLSTLIQIAICSFCIIVTALPLFDLTPKMHQSASLYGVNFNTHAWRTIRRSSFSNGYGLFRRMTGVGHFSGTALDDEPVGWAGLPPSIVARPEIILEAIIDSDDSATPSDSWQELKFRWKPGNVNQRQLQVAPHQPRLDWRMWFAALGSYHHNPWLISFLSKLLNGCSCVVDLLDEPDITAGKKKIVQIRANLYEYDFTRLNNEWSIRIPEVEVLHEKNLLTIPKKVWKRKLVRHYLPPLDAHNQNLKTYLRQNGYEPSVCFDVEQRCLNVGQTAKLPCVFAVNLRKWSVPVIVAFVALFAPWVVWWLQKSTTTIEKRRRNDLITKLKTE